MTGDVHAGLYPLLDGDRCCWLAADFDWPAAMLDALSYLKAARALGVPGALEVSRSGLGAHVWIFFTGPVPAATARALGSGLLREAIALRGRMDLSSYDRLSPYPGKEFAEVHDYHDIHTGVLASSLTKRAPGYLSLGFPDPRKLQHLPPDSTASGKLA